MSELDTPFGGAGGRGDEDPEAAEKRPSWVGKKRGPTVPWEENPKRATITLEPVRIFHEQACKFEKRSGKRGCAKCGELKKWEGHHAYPDSFNVGGSSRNPHAWQTEKSLWMSYFQEWLTNAGLPKGLGKVMVEGRLCFPTRRMNRGPDQGNYRFPIEKHLGDALVDGGWLPDDNWLAYTFGNLDWCYEKDRRFIELTILPAWPGDAPVQLSAQTTLL